ncbi:MAG: hypothetical protein JNM41_11265 [Flavipsychrobacter sp.]|nr:hypothetical protein [Flavipsychrobacter sp.]
MGQPDLGKYNKVLNEILVEIPTNTKFDVKTYIDGISDEKLRLLTRKMKIGFWYARWHYGFVSKSGAMGMPTPQKIITDFLLKNDFAVEAKPEALSLTTNKLDSRFIELTSQGVALKKAGSLKRYYRTEKREYDARNNDNWRKKYWLPIAVVSFLSGCVAGWTTDVGKQYIQKRFPQVAEARQCR